MGIDRQVRWVAIRSLAVAVGASGLGFFTDAWMRRSVRGRLFARIYEVPVRDLALVLGARAYPSGAPSPTLEDRLETARMLLCAGKVSRILVSGDAGAIEGDEVEAMRRWLLSKGVPAAAVQADPQGHRTLASVERAARIFGARGAVVCTQAFHLPRAVFLARRAGIDAVGLAADRRRYRKRHLDRLRELFARQVAFFDSVVFHTREDP